MENHWNWDPFSSATRNNVPPASILQSQQHQAYDPKYHHQRTAASIPLQSTAGGVAYGVGDATPASMMMPPPHLQQAHYQQHGGGGGPPSKFVHSLSAPDGGAAGDDDHFTAASHQHPPGFSSKNYSLAAADAADNTITAGMPTVAQYQAPQPRVGGSSINIGGDQQYQQQEQQQHRRTTTVPFIQTPCAGEATNITNAHVASAAALQHQSPYYQYHQQQRPPLPPFPTEDPKPRLTRRQFAGESAQIHGANEWAFHDGSGGTGISTATAQNAGAGGAAAAGLHHIQDEVSYETRSEPMARYAADALHHQQQQQSSATIGNHHPHAPMGQSSLPSSAHAPRNNNNKTPYSLISVESKVNNTDLNGHKGPGTIEQGANTSTYLALLEPNAKNAPRG